MLAVRRRPLDGIDDERADKRADKRADTRAIGGRHRVGAGAHAKERLRDLGRSDFLGKRVQARAHPLGPSGDRAAARDSGAARGEIVVCPPSSRSPSRPAYRTVRWSAAAPLTERRTGIAPIPLHEKLSLALADRYRIERELGVGGMATVHLAHDLKHDRAVAIKVLKPDLAESLGRERFVREIRLAARLTHPHILPLYDSGEADGFLFYVMPVMQGLTLRQRMETNGALPVEEAVRIVSEVADALDYAHRNDIIHRDIKPENILLHEGHAVVADFGIGKAMIAAAAESTTFTQVGIAIGTPAYMSPEQASGDAVDGRADLFALGCVQRLVRLQRRDCQRRGWRRPCMTAITDVPRANTT